MGETDGGTVMSAPSDRAFQQVTGTKTGRNSTSVKHAGPNTYFLYYDKWKEEKERSLGQDSNPQSSAYCYLAWVDWNSSFVQPRSYFCILAIISISNNNTVLTK